MVLYGIDHIKEQEKELRDARVALLTNITGRNSQLQSDIKILQEMCHLTALFGPEHGVRGNMGAGELVERYEDPETGCHAGLRGGRKTPDGTGQTKPLGRRDCRRKSVTG